MVTGPPPLGTAPDVPSRTPRPLGAKLLDQTWVQDVLGRNPGALLWPIALPIHQIRQWVLDPPGVEYPVDCIGWPSMILGGGGGLCGGANGEDETGFNNETWNVGLILSEQGWNKRKDTGLTFLAIRNGPMYFWESFLDSTRRGRLLVAN